jgi:hypothetical protein
MEAWLGVPTTQNVPNPTKNEKAAPLWNSLLL